MIDHDRPYLIRYLNNYEMYGSWAYILVYSYQKKEALKKAKKNIEKQALDAQSGIYCPVNFSIETIL